MKIIRFKVYADNRVLYGIETAGQIEVLDDQNIFAVQDWSATTVLNFAEVQLLPPIAPSKIVCVGRNYAAHAKELGNEVPSEPLLFLKAPSSLIIHEEAIALPPHSERVEHEGELAVVMRRAAKNLNETENPLDYVLGYTCLNDVTARDLQKRDVQFTRAKSFDTFCPIGNSIETELDTNDLSVAVRVNGAVKQQGRTSQMIFSVPYLIRYISRQMTLRPGDLIATGTPAGVSALQRGDTVEVIIENLPVLRNTVVAAEKIV